MWISRRGTACRARVSYPDKKYIMILDTLTLPAGLVWADKYDWTPVSQSVEISLTGTLVIQEAAQLAGRPITLVGGGQFCWAPRPVIDALYATLQTAGQTMTLDLDADGSHQVIWRRDAQPLEVEPVVDYEDMIDSDLYIIKTLRFMQT